MALCQVNNLLIICVCLNVLLQFSNATITKADVESCISDVKKRLEEQRNTAKKQFEELKTRKYNDMIEQQKERLDNLVAYVQDEKNILATLKQSAIQDDYNVSMCNDTSSVYNLITDSFKPGASAILAAYKEVLDRNHTQNIIIVDRLALNYQQLEQKLRTCDQQSQKLDCFDDVEDDCEIIAFKNEIFDLESSYYFQVEKNFIVFRTKMNSLYEGKLKEVKSFSGDMKSCYRSVKNVNGTNRTDQNSTDSGKSLQPTELLIFSAIFFKILNYFIRSRIFHFH